LPKYLSEHTPGEIVDRITTGAQNVVVHIQRSYGYPKYVLGLAGLLAVAVVLRWPRARTLAREHAILIGFFVAYFVVYALLYSWWAPIAAGDRLVLAQFIPLLLVLASGVRTVLEDAQVLIAGRSVAWTTLVNLAILGIVTTDALWAVSRGVYILRGGG
jgi:hypothetical protein